MIEVFTCSNMYGELGCIQKGPLTQTNSVRAEWVWDQKTFPGEGCT